MNELRFVAACLEGGGRSLPTPESIRNSASEEREHAERIFRKMLEECPKQLELDIENAVLQLVTAWIDESFERGFVSGMRLAAQALIRE